MPSLRVLLVDDDATQLKLCALRLRDAGFSVETASGGDDAIEKVRRVKPDAIMSDVLMGDLDGFGLCRQLRKDPTLADVPIILLSAHYQAQPDQKLARHVGASALVSRTPDFDVELAALRGSLLAGASVVEEQPPAASVYEEHLRTNAHQMSKLLDRAKSAEGRYRTLFENASDPISLLTPDGRVVEMNRRWQEIAGWDPKEMVGKYVEDFSVAGHERENVGAFERATAQAAGRSPAVPIATASGGRLYLDFSTTQIDLDGQPMVLAIGRDVTEQVLAAEERAAAAERYRQLVERIPDVIWTCDASGAIEFMTQNALQVFGYTAEEMMAEDLQARSRRIHEDDRTRVIAAYRAFLAGGAPFDFEYRRQHKQGHWVWLRNRSTAVYERDGNRYIEGMVSDVTERRNLEDSLRHAQKMEAIGQLTGGIAHDFNNLLAVILANACFLSEDLGEHDPRRGDAEEIAAAAERAAALTRQLLAFSRHQVLEPTVVDLGSIVEGVEKMLRRLIGEDIEIVVEREPDPGSIRVDVGQLEQVIVNLVVNARDAMPTGGRLDIASAGVDVDAEHAELFGVPAGSYVKLTVRDTGCGMDAETKRRIFEPFFTTKEVGKGTGLGLATCYGIVKQSHGHIAVSSELGRGTTFDIYLPRVAAEPDRARKTGRVALSGNERILVIEDDAQVSAAIGRILEPCGYRVLFAPSPLEAVDFALRNAGKFDLVLTDVVMPGVSGPEIVEQLRSQLGGVRAVFMSGYSDHAVLRTGVFELGVPFVQKPFSRDALVRKLREALDR